MDLAPREFAPAAPRGQPLPSRGVLALRVPGKIAATSRPGTPTRASPSSPRGLDEGAELERLERTGRLERWARGVSPVSERSSGRNLLAAAVDETAERLVRRADGYGEDSSKGGAETKRLDFGFEDDEEEGYYTAEEGEDILWMSTVAPPAAALPQPPAASLNATVRTDVASVGADDAVTFCGWSLKKGALYGASERFFTIRRDGTLTWYVKEDESLLLAGSLDLRQIREIKREKPKIDSDYSFRIVTQTNALRIDPGSKANFDKWQEALLAAMSGVMSAEKAAEKEAAAKAALEEGARIALTGTPSKAVSEPKSLNAVAPASPTMPSSPLRRTVTFGPGPLGMVFGQGVGFVTIHHVAEGSQGERHGVAIGSKVISVAGESMEGVPRPAVMARIKDEMKRAAEKPMVLELEIPSAVEAAPAKAEVAKKVAEEMEVVDPTAAEKVEKRSSFFGGLAAAIASPFESTHEVPVETAAPAGVPPAPPSPNTLRRTATFHLGPLGTVIGQGGEDLTILNVNPGSQAEQQGVVVGSNAVNVTGEPVDGVSRSEVLTRINEVMQRTASTLDMELESPKAEDAAHAVPSAKQRSISQDAQVSSLTLRFTVTFGPGPLGMAFGHVDGFVTILNVTPGSQAEHQGVVVGSKVISVAGESMEGVPRSAVIARIKDEMQRAAEKPMAIELESAANANPF